MSRERARQLMHLVGLQKERQHESAGRDKHDEHREDQEHTSTRKLVRRDRITSGNAGGEGDRRPRRRVERGVEQPQSEVVGDRCQVDADRLEDEPDDGQGEKGRKHGE